MALGFDTAVSREPALVKHLKSPVAAEADVLVVPDLESGTCPRSNWSILEQRVWQSSFLTPRRRSSLRPVPARRSQKSLLAW